MRALVDYSDSRLRTACVHCGGPPESRDHVPSRVLLDDPFPDNLPVVPACLTCNERFSKDEEYLACLLEVVRVGSTSINPSIRPKIQRIFVERPSLAARIEAGQQPNTDGLHWNVEIERVQNVVLKLAQGHAAFELSEPTLGMPNRIHVIPMTQMT